MVLAQFFKPIFRRQDEDISRLPDYMLFRKCSSGSKLAYDELINRGYSRDTIQKLNAKVYI